MMAVWGLPVPLVLVFLIGVGMGYRSGAPREACITMQPGHTNTVAMATESPYHLEVHMELTPTDDYVVVSIKGSSSFRGFFLQARDANSPSTDAVGSFPSGGFHSGRSETVSCNDVGDSALTHTDPGMKAQVTGTWKAPENDSVKAVYFIATVVRSFDEYWVGILSSTIHLTGRVNVEEDTLMHVMTTTPSLGSTTSTVTTTDSSVPSSSQWGYPETTTALPGGVTGDSYSPSITEDTNSNTKGDSNNLLTSALMDDPSSTGWITNSQRTTGKHEVTYDVFESTAADHRSHVTTDSILEIFTRRTVSKRRTSTTADVSTSADLSTPVDLSTPAEVSTRLERSTQPYETTLSEITKDSPTTTSSETTSEITDGLTSTLSSTTLQPRTQLPSLSSVSTTESPSSTMMESSTSALVEMEVSTTPYETTLSEIVNDSSDSSYTNSSTTLQPRTQQTHLPLESTTESPLGDNNIDNMSTTPSETTSKITDDLMSTLSSTTLQPRTQLPRLSSVSTTESPLSTVMESSTPAPVELSTYVEMSTTPYETTLREIVNDSDSSYTISSTTLQPRTQLTHLPLETTTESPLGTIITNGFSGTSTTNKPTVSSVTETSTGTDYQTTPLWEENISTVEQPVQSTSDVSNESLPSKNATDYAYSSPDPTTLPVNNSTQSDNSQTTETVGLETDSRYNATLEVSTPDTSTNDTVTYGSPDNGTTRQPTNAPKQTTEAPTKPFADASTTFSQSHASTTQSEESTTSSNDEPITLPYNSSTAQVNISTTLQLDNATKLPDTTAETAPVNTSTSPTARVNESTPSSVDTSSTQPSVSLPDDSSTTPTISFTTVDVQPSPRGNSTISQPTTDSTTDGATPTEPQATTTAETTPVTSSTTPLEPQITEEVTVIVTEDSTEVMEFPTAASTDAQLTTFTTETARVTPGVTSSSVTLEEPNEVRMRLRIVDIPFTEDLRDPNSDNFKRVADDVEQAVWDLYMQNNVTTLESVKVLQITRGSVVPEVQLLASQDLNAASKSSWLGVMYNEISSGGSLGNFSVSDISALSADGTFTEVDPCFILPCPESMVCFIFQSTCLSNCFLNPNYCMNDGVCRDPTGDIQLVSCSCTSNHEGERCEVTKVPVTPDSGASNVNSLFAIIWGSVGAVCFFIIVVCAAWLIRRRRKGRSWRHTAKLMGSRESGLSPNSGVQMDSYAKHLTSIRAGVLIDLANISISASEDESNDPRRRSRSASFTISDTESLDQQPRFIDGGVHIGGMPDILQGASTADYELDIMNRPLNPKRKSVSFNDVTEMIDFVATENFSLANKDDANGNFQVRWDFQVDSSQSRGASTSS